MMCDMHNSVDLVCSNDDLYSQSVEGWVYYCCVEYLLMGDMIGVWAII